jgi:mannosyl-oligosaccharide alpha-1,2-mannosidase
VGNNVSCSRDDAETRRSIFETTIRYVGGFLSAYELSGKRYPVLVEKAKQITDKLAHGYEGVRF